MSSRVKFTRDTKPEEFLTPAERRRRLGEAEKIFFNRNKKPSTTTETSSSQRRRDREYNNTPSQRTRSSSGGNRKYSFDSTTMKLSSDRNSYSSSRRTPTTSTTTKPSSSFSLPKFTRPSYPKPILKQPSTRFTPKKTHELLGESPIHTIPDTSRIPTGRILRNIHSTKYKVPDLSSQSSYASSSIKPSSNGNTHYFGVLNSLSNIGKKVVSSIFYNENENIDKPLSSSSSSARVPVNITRSSNPTALSSWNNKELRSLSSTTNAQRKANSMREYEREVQDLDLKRIEKESELRRLDREIDDKRRELGHLFPLENLDLDLDDRLKSFQSNIGTTNNNGSRSGGDSAMLAKQLEFIRSEISTMKRQQEISFAGFQAKIEDLETEKELNKRQLSGMMTELDLKRKQLDQEKEKYINLLEQTARRKRKYPDDDDETGSDTATDDYDDRSYGRKRKERRFESSNTIQSNKKGTKTLSREKDREDNRDYRDFKLAKMDSDKTKLIMDVFAKSLKEAEKVVEDNKELTEKLKEKSEMSLNS